MNHISIDDFEPFDHITIKIDDMNSMINSSTINNTDTLTLSSGILNSGIISHATGLSYDSIQPYETGYTSGDLNIDGDLKIQGESIKDLLEEIKDKLAIFKPNTELEERWDSLRDLRNQYLNLEKEILEKEQMIRILKR